MAAAARSFGPEPEAEPAKEARVVGSELVDTYTVYIIQVTDGSHEWTVKHRYSDFHDLHEKLVAEKKIDKSLLPPKKIIGKNSRSLVEKREKDLEVYLQTLLATFPDVAPRVLAHFLHFHFYGRNLASGEVGFFPSDAVKPCPCVPKPVDYSCQPWYAGAMERLQAETELINRVNSTYLVRHRTKESGEYAISIKYNNEAKHIKIVTKDGFFQIAENRKFKSLMELVEYYKHHSLKEGFRTLDTTLQFPYKEPEHSAGQRANRAGNRLLSPKVLGIAVARYDFCARDMRELSLLKGDMVKIYTKMSANGWWRGEVNGRVGWFPSTYVEEDE